MKATETSTRLAGTALLFQAAVVFGADVHIVSRTCQLFVKASYHGFRYPTETEQSSIPPGSQIWNESIAVTVQNASASATMTCVVSPSQIAASSSTYTYATNFSSFISASAEATSRFSVTFDVDALTPIRFQAAIPDAMVHAPAPHFTQQMYVRFRDLTSSKLIVQVVASWHLAGNYPVVDDPVDTSLILPVGRYQVEALLAHWGSSSPLNNLYRDEAASFLSLSVGCYANCDGSTAQPLLTANDFLCFIDRYTSGSTDANCDGSTGQPELTANDFMCFLQKFAAGCS